MFGGVADPRQVRPSRPTCEAGQQEPSARTANPGWQRGVWRGTTHSPSASVWPDSHSWIIGIAVVGVGTGVGFGVEIGVHVPRASAFSPAGQQVPIAVAWPAGQQAPLAMGMAPRTQHCPPDDVDPVGIVDGVH
jgi:hypothetical protein